ncbi:hypothetical protein L916_19035, partial [Phytophthora nicotianae]
MPNSSASKLDGPSAFSNTNQKENPSVDSSTDVPATDELATTKNSNTDKLD